jgi:hypothetical protein
MSRTYSYKRETKPRRTRIIKENRDKRVVLADYEIEFIEMSLGPSIRLRV